MTTTKYIAILSGFLSIGFLTTSYYFKLQHKYDQMSRNQDGQLDKIDDDTYFINLAPSSCRIDIESRLGKRSLFEEDIDQKKGLRTIKINSIASHNVGVFPNSGNPNTIKSHAMKMALPLHPEIASTKTSAQGYDSGVLFSGVAIDPFTAEFFIGSSGAINRDWNITTLTTTEDLGLDCNNAHVQPTGKYHYHGTPSAYLEALHTDGSEMQKVGYAADGFPIYYKYGYEASGEIVAHQSGYQLKQGRRSGDGVTAPNGVYNGRYFQDYEYVPGISELDECNGRWGQTPDNENEYYYLITDNFPSMPLCFSGTPARDMQKGFGRMGPPGGGPRGGGHRPPPRAGGE